MMMQVFIYDVYKNDIYIYDAYIYNIRTYDAYMTHPTPRIQLSVRPSVSPHFLHASHIHAS